MDTADYRPVTALSLSDLNKKNKELYTPASPSQDAADDGTNARLVAARAKVSVREAENALEVASKMGKKGQAAVDLAIELLSEEMPE